MKFRKSGYYLRSLAAVLCVVRNRRCLPALPFGRTVCIDAGPGRRLWMSRPLDVLIFKEVCLDDEYRLDELVEPALIVDVGAGLGEFAVEAARRFPRARIVSFEPDPERLRLLYRNVSANRCRNVEIVGAAVGTRLTPLADFDWSEVDLLKIDCEGSELDILHSLSPAQHNGVARIALEYHDSGDGRTVAELTRYLSSGGFLVESIPDPYDVRIGHLHGEKPPRSRIDTQS